MTSSVPAPPAPPVAQFTLTVHRSGVEVTDHADHSRHTFPSLLGALGYMELVCRARTQAARDGRLL